MNNPLISVIIPVYNTEQYVGQCIDSVINQTYQHLEIIIINDGSTDNSLEIIQSKTTDCRIVTINKENTGQSDCRRIALGMAHGEYVYFVDSDDYLELNAIEVLYDRIQKSSADICCCRYRFVNINGRPIKESKHFINKELNNNESIINDALCTINIKAALWTRLYKMSFIKENKIETMPSLIHDDYYFSLRTALYAQTAIMCDQVLYNVRQRPSSVSRTINNKGISAYYRIFDLIKEEMKRFGIFECHSAYFYAGYTKSVLYSLYLLAHRCDNYKHFLELYHIIKNTEYCDTQKCKSIARVSLPYFVLYRLSLLPRLFYMTVRIKKVLFGSVMQ